MISGKMVPLGVCTRSQDKLPRSPVAQDNSTTKSFGGKCVVKKSAYVTKLNPRAQGNQNYSARLERMYSKN